MRRVLKYTNAVILLALLSVPVVGYFFVSKPHPEYSGELSLDVAKAAKISRDEHGVPHLEAASAEDAVYLQGYVHAQDRFWQMEATRRLAAGEMAEIVGAIALESDIQSRRLLMRPTAVRLEATLSPEDRRWFAAYTRGVNDWLLANQQRMPLEIQLLGFHPRPWTIADSLLVGLHMFRTLSTTWTTEADRLRYRDIGDKAKIAELFPLRTGTEISMGSNAWAVGPGRSARGKALLAGDPHMEQTWPSTFYLNHLMAPDLDCIGASLPGAPGVIIGHNQRIAWSVTNLHFDVQDLFFNEPRIVAQQKETILLKGGKPVEIVFPVTPNGPVVERQGRNYALRWTPYIGNYEFPFLDLNRASNWQEFRAALKRFPGPSQNFIYADVDGNIGYQAAGKMPIRATPLSHLPLNAQDPVNEWKGFIPFEDLPSTYNPPSGMLITANQNPFPEKYPYPVAGNFTPPYRQHQIAARLKAKPKWEAREMTSVQMDVYSAFHHFLAKEMLRATQGRQGGEEFQQAREVLEGWNGQMEVGQAAPLITVLAYEELAKTVFQRAAGNVTRTYSLFLPSVVEKLLRNRPKDWFPDFDQVLVEAFTKALEEGGRRFGRNPSYWDYGQYLKIHVPNPVLSQAIQVGRLLAKPNVPGKALLEQIRIPLIDNFVEAGPAPLSGGTLTVKQVSPRLGPALRFIADTADWENSYLTITLGQSGHAFTKHAKDYWPEYYNGGAVPLLYKKYKADAVLSIRPKFPR